MLRLLVASAHVPGATGSGLGLHVSARFRGVPRGTRVVPEERSSTWNETLAWPLGVRPLSSTDTITLHLRHWGQPAPRGDLGATTVSLEPLVADPELLMSLSDVPLLDTREQPTGCTITLRCSYVPRGTAGDTPVPLQVQVPPRAVSPGPLHHPGKPPEGKKEDFQVRVKVIEGRQLQGNDIKPVVTVLIGQHRFRTRIRVGNNPYYNEVFSQEFQGTPAQLVAEPIRIRVLDSRAPRAKATIGVFQLDVGTVYRAPGHGLSGKWLSLQHPERPDTGSRGYLRVSLLVLRAGEPAPEQEELAGDGDIEANLLRPPPCATTLQLRVYRAEDLPQAEPPQQGVPKAGDKRAFLAASVRVTFAGRTLCTQVVAPNPNPVWNEVFFFPLRLPPISDEIQLDILGGSRSTKVLASTTLHLSHISSAGAELEEGTPGFLPCFGPTFLPFYGPRPDATKTLSTAYRGRVLLELSTLMEPSDGCHQGTIAREDIAQEQCHLPRHQFGLCGVFYSATMVPPGHQLLRFELSLGHSGDTSDVTCKPAPSVTPYACPLFDGHRYHYLPWHGDKPVVAVTSSWEDVGHRWDVLNLLGGLCRRLERNVKEMRDTCGDTRGDIGRRLLRELAGDCRQVLAQLKGQPTPTPLDTHLRATRLHLLQRVMAVAKRPPKVGWDTLLEVAEGWLGRVTALAVEPQVGVPDAVLWLLQGTQRVACARVPAPDIVFSRSGPGASGRLCGRIHTLFLEGPGDVGAQVRLRLWLGRVSESGDLVRHLEGTLRVYSETYENQTKVLGKWGARGLLGRPSFSDGAGQARPPRHLIQPPRGWRWEGPWSVEPQRRLLPDTETNVGQVLEEVYENQSRRLRGQWGPATPASTDASGLEVPPKEEVACPQGWHVTDGWRVDMTGDVDEAGWEYGVSETPGSPPPTWHPTERSTHTHRRRRWLRTRQRDPSTQGQEQDVSTLLQQHSPEAWEYGTLWGCHFHPQPRVGDMWRRRRWQRQMVPKEPPEVAPIFLLEEPPCPQTPPEEPPPGSKGAASPVPVPPHLAAARTPHPLHLPEAHLLPAPLLHLPGAAAAPPPLQNHRSQSSRVLPPTLDPLWDQTLLFQRVPLYGDPREVRDDPPPVVVEIFDQDKGGAGGALGRSVCTPDVSLNVGHRQPPRLRRYPLGGPGGEAGELLAAFELLHDAEHLPEEEELVPPLRLRVLDTRGFGYRPPVGQTCLRGLARFGTHPHVQGRTRSPGTPKTDSATRWGRIARLLPLLTIQVGTGKGSPGPPPPLHPAPRQHTEEEEEEEGDWWSKFYAAVGDKTKSRRGTKRDRLKVYSCELEAVPEFEGLQDFCQTFPLYQLGGHPTPEEDPVGEFKGLFCLYPLPEDPEVPPPPRFFQDLPPSQPQKCLVRVYIVRAFNLSPRDRNGLCDPYVRVSLGKTTLGQRDHYVPNTLEPTFGRLFEVTGTIPLEKDLRVSLMDHDLLPPDQEIGTTTIDLENRLLSRFRAHCGLPTRYRCSGPGGWRDQVPPSRALELFTRSRGLPAPEFSAEGTAVTCGDQTFLLSHFERSPLGHRPPRDSRERLALHVLHACHLVPEHLETRTLYNSTQPGLEQGKVQMWVDIFPVSLGPPGPPVDITPRKPQRYELRCVVWNTRDVDLADVNVTGQRMSDIYVTGWMDGLEEQRQKTDVHYRSLDGSGAFNWRFLFSFEYLVAEQRCVLPCKDHFWSLHETVRKVPPKLILQVWDNDKFSADDFLGVLELELTHLPRPSQHPQSCTSTALGTPPKWPWQGVRVPSPLSLFHQRRVRGWWPCTLEEDGKRRLSGKLELSLELLTAKEAEERPAGKGREDPNMYPMLPAPLRPESSFLWLQAPLRTLHYGLWHRYRRRFCLGLAALLLLALLLAFVYAAPGYLAMKLVDPLQGFSHQLSSQP
ncbi:fer-1-like protein 5 [Calypte anna]|uniref:fer-1-like protein 5 n=1 Tax=Calypte anna TaxID=9244 RepID=UPI0011C3E925|nr:fer-1-like protein 5 [Calypte anna]